MNDVEGWGSQYQTIWRETGVRPVLITTRDGFSLSLFPHTDIDS